MKGLFVMVDGLDASGKGVIISGLQEWALAKGLRVLRLKNYCEENGAYPHAGIIIQYDVIISDEPSYSHMGKAIRYDLMQELGTYSALSIANAFALDREILYNRVLIPAMKMGKFIFQERGVVTSLVYQPVQDRIPMADIMKFPGNRLALKHAPNLLILTKVSADVVAQRLKARLAKETIFDNLVFQRKLEERYASTWLKDIFERFGAKVSYIDTNPPKTMEENKAEAVKLMEDLSRA